MLLKIVAKE